MSHRIRKSQIFAHLDGRLGSFRNKRLLDHLESCKECSSYLKQIRRLRRAATDSSTLTDPDWSRIDVGVERHIAQIAGEREIVPGWAPIALTLTAAAAVTLAVMLPLRQDFQLQSDGAKQHTLVSTSEEPQTLAAEPSLPAQVLDTLTPYEPPLVGQLLHQGEEVTTPSAGGLLVGLQPETFFELGGHSKWEILSLSAEMPAVELHSGRLLVSVPPAGFAYERGIKVLADGTSFYVLEGVVEFVLEGDSAIVNLINGYVEADRGFGLMSLEPGKWRASRGGMASEIPWIPIDGPGRFSSAELDSPRPLDEQRIRKPAAGHLPRHIIREVLKPAKSKIRTCYEKALKRNPNLALKLDVRIGVERRGAVSGVDVEGLDDVPEMRKCIEMVLNSVSFPPPKGGPLHLVLPLRLYPLQ